MIYIRRPLWDEWNSGHIARHHVVPQEVEEVCLGDPMELEGYKRRILLIGPTQVGRLLAIILEPTTERSVYYPITAYESRKGRRIYQQQKGGEKAA